MVGLIYPVGTKINIPPRCCFLQNTPKSRPL